MVKNLLAVALCLWTANTFAQLTETQGWIFLTHKQQLTNKFDFLTDVQTRSSNKFTYLNTLLLRGAISYNLNKKNAIALGYAHKADWEQQLSAPTTRQSENRIYEQYLYSFDIKRTEVSLRARVEQRWVNDKEVAFSQRARAFISVQIPLTADTAFTHGWYTGLQNELFLNIQHKASVNRHLFDQNRSFVSLGYRFSKKLDAEAGYMYWYQQEMESAFRRNVIQLMITTSF
ncbi:DUF2490 domain-containing protein [Mucilaginibacter sp. PAMB04274]|uniref:DUF2490 domain-containing protein n=1 Tax=Mucilaginibacter sp. PAMB04274 TaxID=3138568 RepID=UPI0031F68FC0